MKFAEAVLFGAGLFSSVACVDKADNQNKNLQAVPDTPTVSANLNPNGFLDLPFSKNPEMKIVQGWVYVGRIFSGNRDHHATDYVLGSDPDDYKTWNPFAVLSPADGRLCTENFESVVYGTNYTVRIKHPNGYETRFLHLDPKSLDQDKLPNCTEDDQNWQPVKRGEEIAVVGDSGTPDGWKHLHMEEKNSHGEIVDPYDLRTIVEAYPDPNLTNGKKCGPKTLWRNCPIDPNLGKQAELATPRATATPIAPVGTVEAKSPTLVPAATASATPAEKKSEYPSGKGGLTLQLLTVDGKPLNIGYLAEFWKMGRDRDGKPILDKYISQLWAGRDGSTKIVEEPGEYAVIFPFLIGQQFNRDWDGPGIGNLIIKEGETNSVKVGLGRITVSIMEKDSRSLSIKKVCLDLKYVRSSLQAFRCESGLEGAISFDAFGGQYSFQYSLGSEVSTYSDITLENGKTLVIDCKQPKARPGAYGDPDCNVR